MSNKREEMKRKVDSGDTNSMAQYTKKLFQGDCVPVNKFVFPI